MQIWTKTNFFVFVLVLVFMSRCSREITWNISCFVFAFLTAAAVAAEKFQRNKKKPHMHDLPSQLNWIQYPYANSFFWLAVRTYHISDHTHVHVYNKKDIYEYMKHICNVNETHHRTRTQTNKHIFYS